MLSEFLISKGVALKQQGAEKVCSCLFCDDSKAHMYVNDDKGVFHCHKCGEAGNIWKLKRHYGEINISHKQKKKEYKRPTSLYDLKKDGREYLKAVRGFSDETIAHFKLTQYQDFIAIPYYKDGILVNFKYRNINEKRFQRFTGGESTLFNMDNIDKTKDIVITEGEFDAISSHQLGITNVISVSIGAGSFNPDWIEFFDSCSGAFYIAYDNDTKGEEGAKKLAEKIGLELGFRKGIKVDRFMRTYTDSNIFACGDCVDKPSFFGENFEGARLASIASTEGRVAGANLYELRRKKQGSIGIFATIVDNTALGVAGLTIGQAEEEGIKVVTGLSESVNRHPACMPGAEQIGVILVFNAYNGVLIGAQAYGGCSVGEFINILGLAIEKKMTAEDLATFQVGTHPALTASPVAYQITNAAEDAVSKLY